MMSFIASAENVEFGTESKVKVYKKYIMAELMDTPESLVKAYLQQVSGIVLT